MSLYYELLPAKERHKEEILACTALLEGYRNSPEICSDHPKKWQIHRMNSVTALIREENLFVDIEDGRVYFLNYDEWYARLDRFRGHKKHDQSTEPVLMSSAAAAGESCEG